MSDVIQRHVPTTRPRKFSTLGVIALVCALLSCPPALMKLLKELGISLHYFHFSSPGWDIGTTLLILTFPTCLSFVFCLFACARISEKARRLKGMACPVIGVLICVTWLAMSAGIGLTAALPKNVESPMPNSQSGQ